MKIQGQDVNSFDVQALVTTLFENTQHKKRLESISNTALGIISSASLIAHRIGRGMAAALNLSDKHAVKQVDRLLSNKKFVIEESQKELAVFLVGGRTEVKITTDWTDFDGDKQTTLSLNLITSHGRATPLLWKTFSKEGLKDHRNDYEDHVLLRLRELVPESVKVTIVADRGFCDTKLMHFLTEGLHFHYTIRIRSNILVGKKNDEQCLAGEYVSGSGRTKTIRNPQITKERFEVATFVCIKAKKMKQSWCIVSSDDTLSGSGVIKWYAKRWGCEPQKDIYLGMGLSKTHIKDPKKRDRLLFIHAISTIILTFLGAAGEAIGLDKYLKVNTSKKRSLSLFNQGIILFNRIPKMCKETLQKLLTSFCELLEEHRTLTHILGVV